MFVPDWSYWRKANETSCCQEPAEYSGTSDDGDVSDDARWGACFPSPASSQDSVESAPFSCHDAWGPSNDGKTRAGDPEAVGSCGDGGGGSFCDSVASSSSCDGLLSWSQRRLQEARQRETLVADPGKNW